MAWDPAQYALFATHRGRPFADLLARVGARPDPRVVVDLGCGDGPLTLGLATRWPEARIVGVDSSPQMLAAARDLDTDGPRGVGARRGRRTGTRPTSARRSTCSSATRPCSGCPTTCASSRPGSSGSLPAAGSPCRCRTTSTRRRTRSCARSLPATPGPTTCSRSSSGRSASPPPRTTSRCSPTWDCEPDVWVTEYQHVLDPSGAQRSPVLEWVRGTGLRPVLDVLTDEAERTAFLDAYTAELDVAYPRRPWGVVLGFSRIFAVAHRPRLTVSRRRAAASPRAR